MLIKAKIWKGDADWVFGVYLKRLDGFKQWHYQDPKGNWAESYTFDTLIQYVTHRGWL